MCTDPKVKVSIGKLNINIKVGFGQGGGYTGEVYEGPYNVTPLVKNQVELFTKDKLMEENVIVEKVPISETSNIAGGYTLYVGEE